LRFSSRRVARELDGKLDDSTCHLLISAACATLFTDKADGGFAAPFANTHTVSADDIIATVENVAHKPTDDRTD
jgi:hypothetical protein